MKLLLCAFRSRDEEDREYWPIFQEGTPEEVKTICLHLLSQGHSVFQGQCDLGQPESFVSRILAGRNHGSFPKSRIDAQQRFLARYTAIGKSVSSRTWRRAESCQEKISPVERNNLDKIQGCN